MTSSDLGAVDLDLDSVPADGSILNTWLPLQIVGRMQQVTGEVQHKKCSSGGSSSGGNSW